MMSYARSTRGKIQAVRRALQYPTRRILGVVGGLSLVVSFGARAAAQTSGTTGEFWPAVDAHAQLPSNLSLLVFGELKEGEDFPYQQFDVGGVLSAQWGAISRPHLLNIDPNKEHHLVLGAGYQYVRTIQSGTPQHEDRLLVQATPRYRPPAGFLLSDRNRVEFRWVNGQYSTRYRNRLEVERDFLRGAFRFTPYAAAEVFYDGAKHSWNEEQYTVGLEWQYKRLLTLQAYYLRQNCTTCTPGHLNVGGATLSLYAWNKKGAAAHGHAPAAGADANR